MLFKTCMFGKWLLYPKWIKFKQQHGLLNDICCTCKQTSNILTSRTMVKLQLQLNYKRQLCTINDYMQPSIWGGQSSRKIGCTTARQFILWWYDQSTGIQISHSQHRKSITIIIFQTILWNDNASLLGPRLL